MHDEAGFLSAIRETPSDDIARLVFADWLDEQDDPTSKTKAAFIRLELQMTDAPEQNLNRAQTLEEIERLATQLDPNWLVVVSHPKLEACRMQFQFECPKQWAHLKPTEDPKTRFCDTCKKNVHYCDTLQEAQNHAANGNCVALTVALARRACLVRPPQPAPARITASARRSPGVHAMLRIRELPLMGTPALPPPGQSVRLTPDMIERLPVAGRLRTPTPEPSPVPQPEPEQRERHAGERPTWKQKRKKNRKRNRNIHRENWEDVE